MSLCNTYHNADSILGVRKTFKHPIFPTSGFHKPKSQGPGLSWEKDRQGLGKIIFSLMLELCSKGVTTTRCWCDCAWVTMKEAPRQRNVMLLFVYLFVLIVCCQVPVPRSSRGKEWGMLQASGG